MSALEHTRPRVLTRVSKSSPSAVDARKSTSGIFPGCTSLLTAFTAATTEPKLAGAPRRAFSTAAARCTCHLCSVPARQSSQVFRMGGNLDVHDRPQRAQVDWHALQYLSTAAGRCARHLCSVPAWSTFHMLATLLTSCHVILEAGNVALQREMSQGKVTHLHVLRDSQRQYGRS